MKTLSVQETMSELLTAQGDGQTAQDVLSETERPALVRYAKVIIRNTPQNLRIEVANRLNLLLDALPGRDSTGQIISAPKRARAFVIREEAHPFKQGESIWRVYEEDGRPLYLAAPSKARAYQALVEREPVLNVRYEEKT